jgi:tetratricopeptide (TPR) repeat protein
MFKLNKNFRSHQGIISLASFVMKLLYTGFPQTVDKMEEERGQYAGPIPTLFLGFGARILGSRMVGLQDINDVHISDFGAEQVILVRDEQQKEKVQQEIGDLALVLTILDSKGMEFDDVFLLDFFTSSPKPATLRRLRCILAEDATVLQQELIRTDGLLCSELKHLYVAVTRPRNQLWIFESDEKVVEPVVTLLTGDTGEQKDASHGKQPLVEVVGKDHPQLRRKLKMLKPAESSDPKKYSEMGYQLIQRGLFKDASFCFRKAKDERGQTIAKAHLSMEEGRGFRATGNNKEFIRLFLVAVDLFKQADQLGNAAFCLEEMNHLEEAGDIWVSISRHDKAAPLYMQARRWRKAATSFDIIEHYGDAAAALRQGELFNELVKYISNNRHHLEPAQTASYGKLCALLVAQGRIKQEMQEHIVDLMGSDREKEEFFRKCKLSAPLVAMLKKRGEFGAAFQELIHDGKPLDALELGLDHVGLDPTINQQEIVKLINYIEYRRMFKHHFCDLDPGKNNLKPVQKYMALPPKIYKALHSWQTLFTDIEQRGLQKVFQELPNGSMVKGILSCAIAIHGEKRIAIETIRGSRFVRDALVIAANIWNSVRTDDQEIPLPLAIVVGAYQVSQSNEVLLMGYTPISTENIDKKRSKWIDVTPKAISKLLEGMLGVYLKLHDVLYPLWKSESRPLCQDSIFYGTCDRPDTCKRRHGKVISSEMAQSRVEVSLTI